MFDPSSFIDASQDCIGRVLDLLLRLLGPILIIVGFSLVSFVTYLYFTIPLVPWEHAWFIPITLLGIGLLFNIVFNWLLCHLTSPGYPPKLELTSVISSTKKEEEEEDLEKGKQEQEHIEEEEEEITNNLSELVYRSSKPFINIQQRKQRKGKHNDQNTPICKKCQGLKPPRCHHCHVCRRCVLGMDHHCPWVANCVGYFNYRYFYLFLVYMTLGCIFCALVSSYFHPVIASLLSSSSSQRVPRSVLFCFLISVSVGLAVGGLLVWHTYLTLTGQSTIEYHQNRAKAKLALRHRGQTYMNEFDLGPTRNWDVIFGKSNRKLKWLLPSFRPPPHDGIHWPTCQDVFEI